MDSLGLIFLLVLIFIVFTSNFIFINQLNKHKIYNFKNKLIYFLLSIITILIGLFSVYAFKELVLIDILKLNIGINTPEDRIYIFMIIIILDLLTIIIISKLYLKRIILIENSKNHEIDLLGKE